MPNLPTLTPAEIEAELKGTEYLKPHKCKCNAYHEGECGCGKGNWYSEDEKLNAARAIRLARENEELRAKLQAQHQATWAMAIWASESYGGIECINRAYELGRAQLAERDAQLATAMREIDQLKFSAGMKMLHKVEATSQPTQDKGE